LLCTQAVTVHYYGSLADENPGQLSVKINSRRKPGPKGPSPALIATIVEIKRRNPKFGCMCIAQQVCYVFSVDLDTDVVRRVLAKHYRPAPGTEGPSWLSFIAHCKDSLWSVNLFRCESVLLKSHWVMVAMDVYTRRFIGFGVAPAPIDGLSVCRMFNYAAAGEPLPKYLSTDHDPPFRFHRWLANLRVLDIEEIKSVAYVPVSHRFVERLVGTVRREVLDQMFFWNAFDLTRKLEMFRRYYNEQRVHRSLCGTTAVQRACASAPASDKLDHYGWRQYCHDLFQIPVPA
jgi:putative transposase